MRIKKLSLLFGMVLALAMIAAPAFAEQCTKTKGLTTVTWDCSFQDMDYTLGDTIIIEVNWTVDAGEATFAEFGLKKFTPRSKKDPAGGNLLNVELIDDSDDGAGTVEVTFEFTDLHLDAKRNVNIGNAHFKLKLWIDEDGDEILEKAGYGVNMHVEDPQ